MRLTFRTWAPRTVAEEVRRIFPHSTNLGHRNGGLQHAEYSSIGGITLMMRFPSLALVLAIGAMFATSVVA
jgi:hypothetical protein